MEEHDEIEGLSVVGAMPPACLNPKRGEEVQITPEMFEELLAGFDRLRDVIEEAALRLKREHESEIQDLRSYRPDFKFNYIIGVRVRAYAAEIDWVHSSVRRVGNDWRSRLERVAPNANGEYKISQWKKLSRVERPIVETFNPRIEKLRRLMKHLSNAREDVTSAIWVTKYYPRNE